MKEKWRGSYRLRNAIKATLSAIIVSEQLSGLCCPSAVVAHWNASLLEEVCIPMKGLSITFDCQLQLHICMMWSL